MRKNLFVLFVACSICMVPMAAWAQSDDDGAEAVGQVTRVYLAELKTGQQGEWLDAAAAHIQWHRDQNDPWTWVGFYVETGENSGMYGWASPNHWWSDFDEYDATMGEADNENVAITTGLYTESYQSWFSVGLPALSNPPPVGTIYPLYQVIDYQIRLGRQGSFLAAIGKITAGLKAAGYEGHYAWSQRFGGDGPVFTLLSPLENWGDLATPDHPWDEVLAGEIGAEAAAEIIAAVTQATVSTHTAVLRVLPDISHAPTQ